MRSLSDTLERLARLNKHSATTENPDSGLIALQEFGSNPGELSGFLAVPSLMPKRPALVVVLHGCGQTAASYDAGSGWSQLGEDESFLVLYPQQTRANNPNLCFNWFSPQDIGRDSGEALSIRQMIAHVVESHDVDPARIFVTGLSAGGAMANVMLASYPEVFSGGAIIAGLPFGVARSVPEAFDRMRGHGLGAEQDLQARLRAASAHQGPWPRLSIWHGTSDTTVDKANASASLAQWRGVHGVSQQPDRREQNGAHHRHVWTGVDGREVMEFHSLSGMGHGTPLDPSMGYEQAGPFMLDVGLSATLGIAEFWGILGPETARKTTTTAQTDDHGRERAKSAESARPASGPASGIQQDDGSIQSIIEKALRTAGLMR
jgi:poly(hydroxyalkanoate) depolymerase family esterase